MQLRDVLMSAACAAILISPVHAQTAAFDVSHRSSLLDGVKRAMSSYIDPRISAAVRDKIDTDRSSLTAIADPQAFAKAVSDDLHAAGRDKHLNLVYSADLPPP